MCTIVDILPTPSKPLPRLGLKRTPTSVSGVLPSLWTIRHRQIILEG
jgi:hypothetical protein